MRIAIVHDELVRKGGAEQVVISFARAFPEAPIYTLGYNPKRTYPEFRMFKIKTSFLGKLVKSEKWVKRLFFPLGIIAMKRLDLRDYDVVLQSTTHWSKYVKVKEDALVLTYCHTPFRLVWRPETYSQVRKASWIKKLLINNLIAVLKKIDYKAAQRTNYFITNSTEVAPRIRENYNPVKPITVINPPVKLNNFFMSSEIGDYYLIVSRFEPYKKVDLVIEAFNKMPEKKLLVVGQGSLYSDLKAMARDNITFKHDLSSRELAEAYAKCKAFIFPQHEDYGITPLEAAASGRPVIAYRKGGILDTMIPYEVDAAKATAVFFEEQTVNDITAAVKQFEQLTFDPMFIRAHAEKFREELFIQKIQSFVNGKYAEYTGAYIKEDYQPVKLTHIV